MALQAVINSRQSMSSATVDGPLHVFLADIARMVRAISVDIVDYVTQAEIVPAWGRSIETGARHGPTEVGDRALEVWLPIGPPLRKAVWMVARFSTALDRGDAEHLIEPLTAIVAQFLQLREEIGLNSSGGRAALVATEYDDCGFIALDHDCQLIFANASAQKMLEADDAIQLSRGTVRPKRYAEAVRFRTILECLADAPSAPGRQRNGSMMLISREGGGRPLLAVLAVPREDEREEVGVVVRLVDPDGGGEGLEPICRLLGLSPVEGRLTRHLVNGLALADAATVLRIKPDTARAYLKQIFLKTGTHRQGELVALLARYRRAAAGDAELTVF